MTVLSNRRSGCVSQKRSVCVMWYTSYSEMFEEVHFLTKIIWNQNVFEINYANLSYHFDDFYGSYVFAKRKLIKLFLKVQVIKQIIN